MPSIRRLICIATLLALPLTALAATPITGTVTNKTTGKPSAGDTVTLIRLAQGMQESTHTTTDVRGHFVLQVPDNGIHLIRVTHDKANYFEPVTPGVHHVDIDVYTAAPRVAGVSTDVEELHIEAEAHQLHIVEVLEVMNQSSPARTQFGPKGFDFYLPPQAHIVRTGAMRDQLPVPASAVPVGDPGHYTFLFPVRPGETQFGILYDLPYTGAATIPLRLASNVGTLAILLPSSISFTPGPSSPFTLQPSSTSGPQVQTWTAQHVSPSQKLEFAVAGTGTLPSQQPSSAPGQASNDNGHLSPAEADTRPGGGLGNPLDQNGTHDPWSKYRWWILSGLALLLATAAGILLRKPATPAAPPQSNQLPPSTPQARQSRLLEVLKEELFALETDHLQRRIGDEVYLAQKAALELVLGRALDRSATPTAASTAASNPPAVEPVPQPVSPPLAE